MSSNLLVFGESDLSDSIEGSRHPICGGGRYGDQPVGWTSLPGYGPLIPSTVAHVSCICSVELVRRGKSKLQLSWSGNQSCRAVKAMPVICKPYAGIVC